MEKQGFELVYDAKNVVRELVATKPPQPGDPDSRQFKRRAPKRPSQQPENQTEKPGTED